MTAAFDQLPQKHFRCILADPPWRFKTWSPKGKISRAAELHYPTLTFPQIAAFPVKQIAADDAFLFLWITGPFAALGYHVRLMRAWGFRPSALMFTWVKLLKAQQQEIFLHSTQSFHMGTGYTSRHNAELCFVGRRGNPQRLSTRVRELIVAPVSEHSRKPIEAHERIEEFCAGPRLELFARRPPSTQRAGEWTLFGNQLAETSAARSSEGSGPRYTEKGDQTLPPACPVKETNGDQDVCEDGPPVNLKAGIGSGDQ